MAFREIVKEYRKFRKDACKTFNGWSRMVDDAARIARRTGALESEDSPMILQASSVESRTKQLQIPDSSVRKCLRFPPVLMWGGCYTNRGSTQDAGKYPRNRGHFI